MIKYGVAVTLILAAVGLGETPTPILESDLVAGYEVPEVLPDTIGSMTADQKEFLEVLRFIVKES